MKNPLRKRLPRELAGDLSKYLVVFLFMTLTIGMISGFLVADDSMLQAYDESFEKYNIEDGNFTLAAEADDALIDEIEKSDVTVCEHFYLEQKTEKGVDSTLRIFKERDKVDLVCLMDGKMPASGDEIALDRMYAKNNDLAIGDAVTIGGTENTISGLVALSDYSALFSNNGDMMFDAVKFGVAIVTEDGFDSFDSDTIRYNYAWKYDKAPGNDTKAKDMGTDLMEDVATAAAMDGNALTGFLPAYTNSAIHFTGDDIGRDRSMMLTLLYILIVIMAFVFGVTTNNTIIKEAGVIGTLRASGYTKGELLRHYICLPILVTFVAAVIGNILGYSVFKDVFAGMYYNSYSLPTYVTRWNAQAFVLTTVVPLLIMLVVNVALIAHKLRLSPLNFLRRDLKKTRRKKAVRLPHFKFFNRFRLRIIFRNSASYVTLAVGILFANILLMFGLMMVPLLNHYQDEVLDHMIADYQYILKTPAETENDAAETYCVSTLKTVFEDKESDEVTAYGIEPDSAYVDAKLPEKGVFISDSYADKYRIKEGDTIRLKEAYGNKKFEFEVKGIYTYPAGICIFMDIDEYRDVFEKDADYFNGYFSDEKLKNIPKENIASTVTEDDLTKISRQLDVSMGDMFQVINVFAIVMFALLVYLLTKLIIEKNTTSISMVKILGYDNREIGKLYLTATTWVVVCSIAVSIPLSYLLIELIYRSMMADFHGWLMMYVAPKVYGEMFVLGLIVYFVVAFFQMARIRKIPMDEALKNVE